MNKIYVAKLGKAVGLKGQQKVHIDSDFPDQFKKGSSFYTSKDQKLIVESYNTTSSLIKFVGIDNVDDAKKLTNKELFTSQEDSKDNCKLEKDQFFWFDIMECLIVENDLILGKVIDIQRLPLDDYFIVETSQELIKQNLPKTFMIPYIPTYILNVDIENKTITTTGARDILEAS